MGASLDHGIAGEATEVRLRQLVESHRSAEFIT
ncbi:hypothetical protein Halar_1699 [halophilic archaeon DL31]|jgi:hypothetical protein|nr:hypothetical protein Halar_1699 [halophilic archaeon DL31]